MAPNNEHYNTQEYAGDRATRTHRTMQHMPDEDRSTRVDIQDTITGSQAAELAPDVRMGDDRAIGDTPNWDGFDSKALYNFATQNNSPTTADDLGRTFNTGGNGLADAANGLLDAVTQLDGAWSGVAADSARAALAPLAQAAGQAGQTAQMMGVQMSRQSVAATEVRKLPPPQDFDQQQSLNAMLAGGPAAMQADLKAQKDASDAVKREQISYLNTYTQAMNSVDSQTPSFVPPPAGQIKPGSGGDARITGSAVPYSGSHGTVSHLAGSGDTSGTTTGVGPRGTGSNTGTGTGIGVGDTFPGAGQNTGTSAAGYTPPAPVSTTPTTATAPGAPGSGAPQQGGFGAGFSGFGGAGGAGAGGAEGTGRGGLGTNTGARGPVPTGVGGQGVAGQGAAGRGAGGMGAGGGRRNGEDDDEHERPAFLVEGDPEGTFGSDQLTAPSVIGGDEDH